MHEHLPFLFPSTDESMIVFLMLLVHRLENHLLNLLVVYRQSISLHWHGVAGSLTWS